MKFGFLRTAVATPMGRVADPLYNLAEHKRIYEDAASRDVSLLVFPELSLTGYTCEDLFASEALLSSALMALGQYLNATKDRDMISIVGVPLVITDKLYNCAAVCQSGRILGVVPKSFLPNYGEFCELRYFAEPVGIPQTVTLFGEEVPFGSSLLFTSKNESLFRFGVEICEDLWSSDSPSSRLASQGALVIANLCASNETIGKDEYRRLLVRSQSAKTCTAYLLANCNDSESTTNTVFSGHSLIAENGTILAERAPFDTIDGLVVTDVDLELLSHERRRINTHKKNTNPAVVVPFEQELRDTGLLRKIPRHPFIPEGEKEIERRCDSILKIQSHALARRVERSFAKSCILGISGGLDSTLALIATAEAMDLLGRPRTDVLGVTMPCFGTTSRTRSNAERLCEALGVRLECVDITASVRSHFADIGHDESSHNVVYENAQARERTQVLMDIANRENGLVIGTGDLSELALGWATYNGDHMSMYGINSSLPKTLIRHMVGAYAKRVGGELASVLLDILDTPVSPELLPADEKGEISQITEDLVGPYELHDFYLYYMIRYGFAPDKLFFMARIAFGGDYTDDVLLHWLSVFVRRFFAQQFKRSCLPDGPKVGSVGFSPRGEWKMPSDASRDAWLRMVERLQ